MLNGNVSGYRINLTSLSSRHQYFMEWNVSSQQLSIYVTGLGKETEDGTNIILIITYQLLILIFFSYSPSTDNYSDPYVPYIAEVVAENSFGIGNLNTMTFFTLEGGKQYLLTIIL